jgi:hypothetical protein
VRARILEKMGKPRLAAASYRRYVALRAGCDAELRPELQEAQRHLARLEATAAQ